jgi:hypothetical protein
LGKTNEVDARTVISLRIKLRGNAFQMNEVKKKCATSPLIPLSGIVDGGFGKYVKFREFNNADFYMA